METTHYQQINEELFDSFSAYQHFLYHIELSHLRAYAPWGKHLTSHFIDKLNGFIAMEDAGYITPGTLVRWVQEMNTHHQKTLLAYIMIHHGKGWREGFNRVDRDRLIKLENPKLWIDPEGNIYRWLPVEPNLEPVRYMHLREIGVEQWFKEISEQDYIVCKEIADWNGFAIPEHE